MFSRMCAPASACEVFICLIIMYLGRYRLENGRRYYRTDFFPSKYPAWQCQQAFNKFLFLCDWLATLPINFGGNESLEYLQL